MYAKVGDNVIVKNISRNEIISYKIMPVFIAVEPKKFNLYKDIVYSYTEYSDADIEKNEISANTEFAKNILGKEKGHEFLIGEEQYKILEVRQNLLYIFENDWLLEDDAIKEEDKDELIEKIHKLIKQIKNHSKVNKCEFYHETDFTNLDKIISSNKIMSRNSCLREDINFEDNALVEVISHTKNSVKEYARFYFRTKNPTHYLSEGYRGKIQPCILVFNQSLIFNGEYNIIMTNKNAGCKNFEYNSIYNKDGLNKILNYDWSSINSSNFNDPDVKQKSCAEILIKDSVSLEDLTRIIFRNESDKEQFIFKYGRKDYNLEVDPSMFFNDESHFITKNFFVRKYNEGQTIIDIEYFKNSFNYLHSINIYLKDGKLLKYDNIEMINGNIKFIINKNISEIKKIEYYCDNILVERW